MDLFSGFVTGFQKLFRILLQETVFFLIRGFIKHTLNGVQLSRYYCFINLDATLFLEQFAL